MSDEVPFELTFQASLDSFEAGPLAGITNPDQRRDMKLMLAAGMQLTCAIIQGARNRGGGQLICDALTQLDDDTLAYLEKHRTSTPSPDEVAR